MLSCITLIIKRIVKKRIKKKKHNIDLIPIIIISFVVWFVASNFFITDEIKVEFKETEYNIAENDLKTKLFEIKTRQSAIEKIDEIPDISNILLDIKTKQTE